VISLPINDPNYTKFVTPYLQALRIDPTNVAKASTNNRFVDAGGRANNFKTNAQHAVIGVEGLFAGYDYTLSYVNSANNRSSNYAGGFMSKNCYNGLKAAGLDPFAPSGGNAASFATCLLTGLESETKTTLNTLAARGSGELFNAPAGPALLGVGADYNLQTYDYLPSAIAQGPNKQNSSTDTPFGGAPGALPVGATRSNWGTFAELVVPVTKTLEVTGAVRYDSYSDIKNRFNFNLDGDLLPEANQGNANAKTTYKAAFRYQAMDSLLIRGSYGTGFKAPNLDEISSPISNAGVTSGKYDCPVKQPDPRAIDCKGNTQYDLLSGGNPLKGENGLKPEESQNFLLGARIEPAKAFTFGMDYWSVTMKNQIVSLPETFPFGEPSKYDSLFSTVFDAGQGQNKLSTLLPNFNLGTSKYEGIDFDSTISVDSSIGRINVNWAGTVMLTSEVEIAGKTVSSLGRFDDYNNATSRYISRVTVDFKTGQQLSHALTWNWRSGYVDQVITADDGTVKLVNADGTLGDYAASVRQVQSYSTIDWQSRFTWDKNFGVTFGIKNLLDQNPPFSQRTAGGGNQVGYDGRYASPLGRQLYVVGSVRF